MASFKDLEFTTAEFSRIAGLDKKAIESFEKSGHLKTDRKKIGNVERKMVKLQSMQEFFSHLRTHSKSLELEDEQNEEVRHGDQGLFVPTHRNQMFCHRTQMFYNVKGGTGKSTLTAQYVMNAALLGYKVLALDLDGQGHLTLNLDVLNAHELPTIYDVLINDLNPKDAIVSVAPGLDLIPANLNLCTIEIPLNQKPRREYRLSEAIKKVAGDYDLIVADTNPAASILNSSMLVAADLINVVCATNPLSFHGMSLVMATIEEMEREFGRQVAVRIIPNMYDNREVISQEVLGELKSQFEANCTKTVISRSADLNEATKRRTTVLDVNSKGTGASDIKALTQELLSL